MHFFIYATYNIYALNRNYELIEYPENESNVTELLQQFY